MPKLVQKKFLWQIGLYIIALTLFLSGVIIPQFWSDLLLKWFFKELSLQPGTIAYKRWIGAKSPMKTSYYFWNWTNPEQINDENIKPRFVEMGPYVFWQYREKVNVTYNAENDTITYRNKLSFYYDPELSNGSLSDNVTSINTIAATASSMTRKWNKFLLYPLSAFLRSTGQQVSLTRTVGELLFEGFEDPIIKISSYVPGLEVPDKFAYFYGQNNTLQPGIINMDAGANDINKFGQVYFVDYKNESDAYPNCKEIKGTNGELFAPFVTPDRTLEMYFPESCMRVFHYYLGESSYKGLKTYVFGPTRKTFGGIEVPELKCYFSGEDAPPEGIINISPCVKEAHVAVTLPHMFMADPYYRGKIEGMNPDEMKHMYAEELEPTTGIQVKTLARLQVNVRLQRNPGLSLYKNVPDVYIPVLWHENISLVETEYVILIHLLNFSLKYGAYIWYGIAVVTIIVTGRFVLLQYSSSRSSLVHIKKSKRRNYQKNAMVEEKQKLKIGEENGKEMF